MKGAFNASPKQLQEIVNRDEELRLKEEKAARLRRGHAMTRDELSRASLERQEQQVEEALEARSARSKVGKQKLRDKVLAQRELANRELCRRKLMHFTKRFHPTYQDGWVHRLLAAKLEKFSDMVILELSPRLLWFMPPRSGKSELCSLRFPAWHFGRAPVHEFICASHTVTLPEGFSRTIKDLLHEPEYQAMFPETHLDPDAQATSGWKTTQKGGYTPAGVGTGITGKGAHIFNVDDPVKDAEQAQSSSVRQAVIEWWETVSDTRLAPGGGVLGVQTRWHDGDWAGHLLNQEKEMLKEYAEREAVARATLERAGLTDTERKALWQDIREAELDREAMILWDVMSFPALADKDEFLTPDLEIVHDFVPGSVPLREEGEALHPARFNERHYRFKRNKMRAAGLGRFWNAMYQQDPVGDEGEIFNTSMIRYYTGRINWPQMAVGCAFDLAITENKTSDWTVGLIGAMDWNDNLYVLDAMRIRSRDYVEKMVDFMVPYKSGLRMFGCEMGHIYHAIAKSLKKELEKKFVHIVPDETLVPIADKFVRMTPARNRMQVGKILLPKGAPWAKEMVDELKRIPNSTHDDYGDALAWLCRMFENVTAPEKPDVNAEKAVDKWLEERLNRQFEKALGRDYSGALQDQGLTM